MENILDRIRLLMSYDTKKTLSENYEILETESIDEQWQGYFRGAGITSKEGMAILAKDFQGAFSKLSKEITGRFKSVDDFVLALSKNKISGIEKGALDLAFLKTTNKEAKAELRNLAASNFVKSKQFKEKYGNFKTPQDLTTQLKNTGEYSEAGINAIVKEVFGEGKQVAKTAEVAGGSIAKNPELIKKLEQIKNAKELKGSSPEVAALIKDPKTSQEAVQNMLVSAKEVETAVPGTMGKFQKIGQTLDKYTSRAFGKIKELKGKMNLKNLVIYGLAGWGTYSILKDLFSDDPNPSPVGACVANLDSVTFDTMSNGDPVALLSTTGNVEIDANKGLKFYSNGRVFTGNNNKSGNYSCKPSGEIAVQTESKKSKLLFETVPLVIGDVLIYWDDSQGSSTNTQSQPKKQYVWKDTPFKNKQEGDLFRKWMNDNFPDFSKQIKLDPQGSYNNSYIKKAWTSTIPDSTYTYGSYYSERTGSTDMAQIQTRQSAQAPVTEPTADVQGREIPKQNIAPSNREKRLQGRIDRLQGKLDQEKARPRV